jgi:hypothetical protein
MSDATVFRQFAEEAMRDACTVIDEGEKRALEGLACTWAQAALMSDRVFRSPFISAPRVVGEPTPLTHS